MKVLIGCESSRTVAEAFEALGHEVLSCDLLPADKPGRHYQGSVFDVIDFPWDLAIFHFPCTDSSVSGARHFEAKKLDGRYYASNSLWLNGWRRAAHIPKVCFEHPISVISSLFRKPDQIIQPWQFGHGETKATALWLRGLEPLKPTSIVEGREQKIWKMPPSENRWKERSKTFPGIAQAMAEQWGQIEIKKELKQLQIL
jgi:hypothetical protein